MDSGEPVAPVGFEGGSGAGGMTLEVAVQTIQEMHRSEQGDLERRLQQQEASIQRTLQLAEITAKGLDDLVKALPALFQTALLEHKQHKHHHHRSRNPMVAAGVAGVPGVGYQAPPTGTV